MDARGIDIDVGALGEDAASEFAAGGEDDAVVDVVSAEAAVRGQVLLAGRGVGAELEGVLLVAGELIGG